VKLKKSISDILKESINLIDPKLVPFPSGLSGRGSGWAIDDGPKKLFTLLLRKPIIKFIR
jgi:hypothetical protein